MSGKKRWVTDKNKIGRDGKPVRYLVGGKADKSGLPATEMPLGRPSPLSNLERRKERRRQEELTESDAIMDDDMAEILGVAGQEGQQALVEVQACLRQIEYGSPEEGKVAVRRLQVRHPAVYVVLRRQAEVLADDER